ncbi:SDR family oxidoreductase [Rubrobacter tropicus]|uniref:SDR family oxidoreductase n=1 Tax=Rubrobacter tropicus TaxID=2653851 RepID=A0A6G8QDU5_9ACTN|nr:SDR family oxidoreductase [Rubrobacter tropicus]QIN84675.1 SDR family oxidoreductase [Rubrobacter tropicus]
MLLEGKNAVVYGGGGAIGGAVARAFAGEGARVFLAGRTLAKLDEVAGEIRSNGGVAETAVVDALDERAVEEHAGAVVEEAGGIDVSFNAISIRDVQLVPFVEISRGDFMSPILTGTTTHFLTARAAGRRMAERGSGVILTLSSSAVRGFVPGVRLGGFGIAGTAIEALTKLLAAELGPQGVRAVCLRSEGIPESWKDASTEDWSAPTAEIEAHIKARSLLGRTTTLADVGNAAAFLASDRAAATTGTVFNLTSGTVVD